MKLCVRSSGKITRWLNKFLLDGTIYFVPILTAYKYSCLYYVLSMLCCIWSVVLMIYHLFDMSINLNTANHELITNTLRSWFHNRSPFTHCGLVTPYGDGTKSWPEPTLTNYQRELWQSPENNFTGSAQKMNSWNNFGKYATEFTSEGAMS